MPRALVLIPALMLASCAAESPSQVTASFKVPMSGQESVPTVEPAGMARGLSPAAARLAGSLRPYEDDLPSRQQLEALDADPVELLLELAGPAQLDIRVRANALTLLGSFSDSEAAVERLLEVALDEVADRKERGGAIYGLGRADLSADRVRALLPLLDHGDHFVEAHAVKALAHHELARPRVRALADSADTHPDVARIARRALESGGP